ncbi:MAG: DUF4321 domain-containing protein [Clostridia bacterium]|nr:DUF4321 domain-containing protein [Clostridia bacterium]
MKSKVVSIIVILAGLVLGSFIGEVTSNVPFLSWLNFGQVIGIPNFEVNLYALNFNFGLTFNCTISCILGLILALLIYYKVIK